MNRNLNKRVTLLSICSVAAGLMFLPPTVQQASAESQVASVQQAKTVSGLVKDSQGPLIGATIMEKGTSNGTVTDMDGKFTLSVKPGATLVISYVGYDTKEISTGGGKNHYEVTLSENAASLNEVVVIGYGTQRKEAVTGSVASINGDAMREVPSSDITGALQGRVAGVQMMQTSSKPGASMQIRIRGTRSLNASNDPLVVLDGIPFAGSINDIDPNNIKSMDILKDASATAIYGSRGANGVIIITTYKGYQEQKPQVSYNGYIGAKTLFARYPMMNAEQFAKLRKYAGKYNNGLDETYPEDGGPDTDWQDLLFKTGITTNQDVSVSGGTQTTSYNFGVSYYRDEAVIPTQNFNRYALHASIDQQLGKYVKIGFSSNSNYSITNGASISIYNTLSASPLINPYNEDGTLKERVSMENDTQWVYTKESIENLGDKYKDQTTAYGTYNTLYGEIDIPYVKGLKYRLNLGLNYRHKEYGNYVGEGVFSDTPTASSHATWQNENTTNWAIENILTYDRSFGKHNINIVGLYSAEQTTYKKSYMYGLDIPADAFQYYNIGQAGTITVDPSNQGYYQSGLMSVMGRAMYNYDDRYMASVTLRSDGSSRLAKGHQWHTYPAVSLGWNIGKEAFMENVKWLDNLKLRVGYGETSNQSVDPYKTLGLLSTRAYNFGTTNATGYYVTELPNPELGWEYSQTWNFGLDFSVLNGRLSGTIEYYTQKTKDLLLSVNLPSTSGVGSYMGNIGKTENKGIEISLNGKILDNYHGWTWEAGINFYKNDNKLVSLVSGTGETKDKDESNWWFVGHPINVIYDYQKIGIWQEDEEEARQIAEPGGNAGMIKVKYNGDYDENGLPTRAINTSDRQIMKVDPDWEGGFNTMVSYKGFDLSMIGTFRHGGILISTLYGSTGYLNMLNGRRNNVNVDYWTEDNPNGKYPKPGGVTSNDNPKYGTTLGYFSGSYLKVRTITLGYNFKKEWIKSLGLSRLRVYATVQNPFVLFSPYHDESGMDPETNSYGNENQAVTTNYQSRLLVVGYNTPSTRNFIFGLNVTF